MTAAVESSAQLDEAGRALLFTDARTANTFSDEPVTDAELSSIWELAKWAPTMANTQPLRLVYVRTQEGKDRLLPHIAEGNRAKTATAPVVAILAADNDFHEHIPTIFPIRPEMREMMAANPNRDQLAKFNGALQAGYFILSVRAHGLAAGPMLGYDADGIDAEFFPEGRFKTLLVINIGHPGESPWFDRLPRLDHESVVQWA